MTINYSVSLKNSKSYQRWAILHGKANKKMILKSRIIISIFLAIFTYYTMETVNVVNIIVSTIILTAVLIPIIIFYPYFMMLFMFPFAGMAYNKELMENQSFTLNDDEFVNKDVKITAAMNYSAISRLMFNKDCFYIEIEETSTYIIPQSSFADKDEQDRFFNILCGKTGLAVENK